MSSASEVSVQILHMCQFTLDFTALGNTKTILSVRETQSLYFSDSASLCGCNEFHFKETSPSLFHRRETKKLLDYSDVVTCIHKQRENSETNSVDCVLLYYKVSTRENSETNTV
jgi:hypothetical protein